MDDLISRQAAIDEMNEWIWDPAYQHDVVASLRAMPSAQPEIVRCRDCKHYVFAENRAFGFPVKRCEVTGFEDVDDYDFCSRAERRTDD